MPSELSAMGPRLQGPRMYLSRRCGGWGGCWEPEAQDAPPHPQKGGEDDTQRKGSTQPGGEAQTAVRAPRSRESRKWGRTGVGRVGMHPGIGLSELRPGVCRRHTD